MNSYTLQPVGFIRSTVKGREDGPRQRARMVKSSDGSEVEGEGREGREGLGEVLLVVIF